MSFAKRVAGIFDFGCIGSSRLNFRDDFVTSFRTASLLWIIPGHLLCLLIGNTPAILTDCVKRLHSPFDDVERIYTAFTIRSKLIDAVGDPTCSITSNNFDAGELIVSETFIKLFEHRFAVAIGDPDNCTVIVIYDYRDVLVPLPVTSLIDTDIHQAVQAPGSFRFQVSQSSGHAISNGLPVDPHVARHSAAR